MQVVFSAGETTVLHVSALFSTQAKAHETLVGGAMEFMVADASVTDNPISVYAGSWIRIGDALIPMLVLSIVVLDLGLHMI